MGRTQTQYERCASADPQALWAEFQRTGAHIALNGLTQHYTPLVERVAGRVSWRLPKNIERDDLVCYGTFGLIDAIEKFDVSRDVGFERYAGTRITGAIYDELRLIDWVPRSVRTKIRAFEGAGDKLTAELQRWPTESEVATELGLAEHQLNKIITHRSSVALANIDQHLPDENRRRPGTATLVDLVPDQRQGPEDAFEIEEIRQLLAAAVNRLPSRERFVLTRYFYQRQTLRQIAELLGVTEGRVCQICSKGVDQLRAGMSCSLYDAA